MDELLSLIRTRDVNSLFLLPTENPLLQFFRYIFVGGCAFVVDAGTLFLLHRLGLHYLVASAFGFILGLCVNFSLSKRMVFSSGSKYVGRAGEFFVYGLIGLAGLAFTEVLMFLFTGVAGFYFMASKVITAAIVLLWNFAARKWILYR